MSIQSEIERINNNVQTTLSTIAETGVDVGATSDALPAAASALANEKVSVRQGTSNAGKLLYVDSNGSVSVLTLGDGLAIQDGVIVASAGGTAGSCGVYIGDSAPADENASIWLDPSAKSDVLTIDEIRAICK